MKIDNMKKFTRKERAEIYLKAAILEDKRIELSPDDTNEYLFTKARFPMWRGVNEGLFNILPELEFVSGNIKKKDDWERRHHWRILALLFAREIALNP